MHSFDLHSFYEFVKAHIGIFVDNSEIHTFHTFYPVALLGTCCQTKIDRMNSIYENIKEKLRESEIAKIKEILGVNKILFFRDGQMFCEI